MGKASRLRAERERAREEHARLVVERAGDPNFVQRQRVPGGHRYTLNAEAAASIENQLERFREKFGREPGPDDPLFFDPDIDQPTPVDTEKVAQTMRQAINDAGLDPAYADAYEQVGFILTEQNQHLFSAHEIEAWEEALEASRQRRAGRE